MNPGVAETISELHGRGVRVALANASPMKNIVKVLDACGLDGIFEVVVSGYSSTMTSKSRTRRFTCIRWNPSACLPRSAAAWRTPCPGSPRASVWALTVFAKREERFGFTQETADVIIDRIPDLIEAGRKGRAPAKPFSLASGCPFACGRIDAKDDSTQGMVSLWARSLIADPAAPPYQQVLEVIKGKIAERDLPGRSPRFPPNSSCRGCSASGASRSVALSRQLVGQARTSPSGRVAGLSL